MTATGWCASWASRRTPTPPRRRPCGRRPHRVPTGRARPGGGRVSTPTAPVRTAWTTSWTDVLNTGTWRAALPVHEWRPSPCHVQCPIGNAIPIWIAGIDANRYREAWEALVATNPFPAVTGRVCAHPCETECNRAVVLEGAVGINGLEQFLGDQALAQGWPLPTPGASQSKRVAVVGGGPAGLSAAYHLRLLGYDVTVFESSARLGGLLVWGIPEYRLPGRRGRAGDPARSSTSVWRRAPTPPIADEAAFATLRAEFDAVFVAVGRGTREAPPLPGRDGRLDPHARRPRLPAPGARGRGPRTRTTRRRHRRRQRGRRRRPDRAAAGQGRDARRARDP